MKKDFRTRQTEILQTGDSAAEAPAPGLSQSEIRGRNRDLQYRLLGEYRQGVARLHRIFEALHNELTEYPGDLPTSFFLAESEIAKCISGCLQDVREQNECIPDILSLVRGYGVVAPVRAGNPTVSLDRLHLLLQDNFPDSCLCRLLNIFLSEFMNVHAKVISFY
jgi:hypothetical protein